MFTRASIVFLVKIAGRDMKKAYILAEYIYGILLLCSLFPLCLPNHIHSNVLTKSSFATISASESLLLQ